MLLTLFLLLPTGLGIHAQEEADSVSASWNAELAEHLLNRAGFGARPGEIEETLRMGREAAVERLLGGGARRGEYHAQNYMERDLSMTDAALLDEQGRQEARKRKRRLDEDQVADFSAFWIERMVSGDDPLREKMALFWHGHFATSQRTVKNSYEMILQNELFYDHALGRFEDLLRGIVHDPAMLEYLDNDENKKGKPNENLARELMELFTLGEGNYTEADIKAAARALTGWSDRGGEFKLLRKQHDNGDKTIFGQAGNFDGDDLVDLLLQHPACGPYLAGELIAWFEGVDPEPERAWFYGEFLAANDYDLTVFLRRLFNDPAFYREELIGNRIAGPIELMVSTSRRIGIKPPARLLHAGSRVLGQHLLHPPSVKGWDEGESWITTSTLMQRSNLAGVLLGVVDIEDLIQMDSPPTTDVAMTDEVMEAGMTDGTAMEGPGKEEEPATDKVKQPKRKLGDLQALKNARSMKWRPRMSFTVRMAMGKKRDDAAMIDSLAAELLAVSISTETRDYLVDTLASRRHAAGIKNGRLLQHRDHAELILRDVAHVMLSLPESQLN